MSSRFDTIAYDSKALMHSTLQLNAWHSYQHLRLCQFLLPVLRQRDKRQLRQKPCIIFFQDY